MNKHRHGRVFNKSRGCIMAVADTARFCSKSASGGSGCSKLGIRPRPTGNYFVETAPRFANYRTRLSSDYLLNALNIDPT